MQIDDTVGILRDKVGRENTHPAREYNQVNLEQRKHRGKFGLDLPPCPTPRQVQRRNFVDECALQSNRVGLVAYHQRDLNIR